MLLRQRKEIGHALGFGWITGDPAYIGWHGVGNPRDRVSGKVPSLVNR